jgi:hypothetical protein
VIYAADDDHHVAHEIGKITAERFGINGPAFFLCPTSFNYGCQHGFFQYALGKAHATDKAARMICGSLDRSYSAKFIFSCYHGVGHGVLLAMGHNLGKALAACDTLETAVGHEGCWQGVFMENVNASMKGTVLQEGFSRTDPLAPCNVVPEKYRHQCFINHAGWLMKFFNNGVQQASEACLKAPDAYLSPCLRAIGLMVTNPGWQPALARDTHGKAPRLIAWDLCLQFPKDHREQCVIGGIDAIMNFDEFYMAKGKAFCVSVDADYQFLCYQAMGAELRNHATDSNFVRENCAGLDDEAARACLQGAGEESPTVPIPAPTILDRSLSKFIEEVAQAA